MITEAIFDLIFGLVNLVLGLLPELPDAPDQVYTALDYLYTYIRAGIGFIWIIFDRSFVIVLLPVCVAIANWREIYHLVMWVVRKLPFGIE